MPKPKARHPTIDHPIIDDHCIDYNSLWILISVGQQHIAQTITDHSVITHIPRFR